ncbi:nucleotide exchange factor GrpE [Kitasatospora kifunensis]|uniref:Nucleotide exchange factor GrpE n=1 Tax=Kitasatospora kifunensis TaxID=58351 RepID=A0A7W7VTA0_KITKI|nr:nucleotide exchange factor GrpE [Kitasatospora kifunensis]MBB4922066.1 hypothetical protein [Kitasatospora kifunensis]
MTTPETHQPDHTHQPDQTHEPDRPTQPPELPHPLAVPQRALDIDLAQSFSQLLYRASLLQRLRGEEAQAAKEAQQELLGLLIEVDDALQALRLDPELELLGRGAGIDATRRRLLGKLAKAGVRPMRLDGLAADPTLSEIVGGQARPELEPETVVQTVVTGFFWHEEVLRRAQVVVATAPPTAPPAAQDDEACAAVDPQDLPAGEPSKNAPRQARIQPSGTRKAKARRGRRKR